MHEIILHETAKEIIEEKINIEKINESVEKFVADPIKNILTDIAIKNEIKFKEEIIESYNKWKNEENKYLQNR